MELLNFKNFITLNEEELDEIRYSKIKRSDKRKRHLQYKRNKSFYNKLKRKLRIMRKRSSWKLKERRRKIMKKRGRTLTGKIITKRKYT